MERKRYTTKAAIIKRLQRIHTESTFSGGQRLIGVTTTLVQDSTGVVLKEIRNNTNRSGAAILHAAINEI
ncbi:MAG: hypothetical protein K2G90_07350 [Muribaculaceae bacterium]|nr:hypothetical protein [Muribaculaceae bacterium]